MRRKNSVRKGSPIERRTGVHTYSTTGLHVPSLNGQRLKDSQIDAKISTYEIEDGWVPSPLGENTFYKMLSVPADLLVTWSENPRHAEEEVNSRIENGVGIEHKKLTGKAAQHQGFLESIKLLRDPATQALAIGMHTQGGPLDPINVIMRKDGLFDVPEGNRRTAVSHLLCGFLRDLEEYKTLPKLFLKHIDELLLKKEYPPSVQCQLWKGMTVEKLHVMLQVQHGRAKLNWDAFVQARELYTSFETSLGKTFELKDVNSLKNIRRLLLDKRNIHVLDLLAKRNNLKQYESIRWRIMAFAAYMVFKCQYNVPSNYRTKFDAFRRFYENRQLRKVCDGGPLTYKDSNGTEHVSAYTNDKLEVDLMGWIAESRITDTVQISDLPRVLFYDDIREKMFLQGDPRDVGLFTRCIEAVERREMGAAIRIFSEAESMDSLFMASRNFKKEELKAILPQKENLDRMLKNLTSLCQRLAAMSDS